VDAISVRYNSEWQKKGLSMSKGLRGRNAAIDELIENRIYRPGTVDAVLEDAAISIEPGELARFREAPDLDLFRLEGLPQYRPVLAALVEEFAPAVEPLEKLRQLAVFTHNLENLFPSPDRPASGGRYRTPMDFRWGGTEETVVAKGSDWCVEVARVYCALAQVAGFASRLVYCWSLDGSGSHAIAECYSGANWVLIDPLAPKIYTRRDGQPLSAADMVAASDMEREEYTASHEGYCVNSRFFQLVAVSEYRLAEAAQFDYGISQCNAFYRRLLEPIWNRNVGDSETK
jgi:hypothetical protein